MSIKTPLIISLMAFIAMAFSSCIPDEPTTSERWEEEVDEIVEYLNDNSISADYVEGYDVFLQSRYVSGIDPLSHPEFDDEGESVVNYVKIGYKGMLLDGTVFDESEQDSTIEYAMSQLIFGMQIGLYFMCQGDSATFYIPSLYGYGNAEIPGIPANSILKFDVFLESFDVR